MKITDSGINVFKNTLILYFRMFLTIGISLYTTRLVLNNLGVIDYGIYNLIAGIVLMLSFLNSAMATSTQRYLSFYQGKEGVSMQKTMFSNSLILHIIIGILIVIALETIGLFLFDGFLNIPKDRRFAAISIYHFMSLTVFFTVISAPFSGSLIAHENMFWVALINIIEVLFKLAIALLLGQLQTDKLIFYGLSMALISIVNLLMYSIFCINKYEECTLFIFRDYNILIIRELRSFAGWNLFGAICGVGRSQGLAVILNLFLGSTVNAAYGIANQISTQLSFFSTTLLQAINPQIMKSEGSGDRKRMLRLSMMASKFSFFLLAFIAIPSMFEMTYLLKLWLKEVPKSTVIFCNLILVSILTNQLTIGLQSAFQATGKIKAYQIIVGSVLLLNLPIAYLLLKNNSPVYVVLLSYIVVEFVSCLFRLYLLNRIAGLSINEYIKNVFIKELVPIFSIIFVAFLITKYFEYEYRFLITISMSIIVFFVTIYFTGLSIDEKLIFKKMLNKMLFYITKSDKLS
jgi:O-antigen/teichoic acid export membrane protein